LFDDAKTLYEALRRGHRVSNNGPMLGYRKPMPDGTAGPYVWTKYSDVCWNIFMVLKAYI
jgi:hypothetical protein